MIQNLNPHTGQPLNASITASSSVSLTNEETVYSDFCDITHDVYGGDAARTVDALAAMGADASLLASMHDRFTQASPR